MFQVQVNEASYLDVCSILTVSDLKVVPIGGVIMSHYPNDKHLPKPQICQHALRNLPGIYYYADDKGDTLHLKPSLFVSYENP